MKVIVRGRYTTRCGKSMGESLRHHTRMFRSKASLATISELWCYQVKEKNAQVEWPRLHLFCNTAIARTRQITPRVHGFPPNSEPGSDVSGVARSTISMVQMRCRHKECILPSREIGPIAYFYPRHPPGSRRFPLPNTVTSEEPERTVAEHSLASYQSTIMHSSLAILAFAAVAVISSEAFVFTVWLGDKCTITGARPSDQELLVIPQAVGSDGCMV